MPKRNDRRVFISSAFRDLKEAREHFVNKVVAGIHALCRERGIRVTGMDLQ